MRFCFNLGGLTAAAALIAAAAPPVHQASLVVRADHRTGRLVRAVLVTPQAVSPVVVQPRVVTASPPSRAPAPADRGELVQYAARTAQRYDVDPLLVHSVIQVESGYNPYAISSKGARGVMQLMPGTARRLEVTNSFDPFQNIEGGVRYLRYLLDLFNSERLAVAAYNAGEGAVFRYGNVPPYPETMHYVRQVGKKVGAARQAAQKVQATPSRVESAPAHPPIRHYIDSHGKVHYETRSGP